MNSKFLTYTPYNPSWTKWCVAFGATTLLGGFSCAVYSAHNLYSYFQYNKSLEKDIEVKLHGEDQTRIVKCEPVYSYERPIFDAFDLVFILYNMTETVIKDNMKVIQMSIDGNYSKFDASIDFGTIIFFAWCVSLYKHIFSPSEGKFEFIDIKTGEEISYDVMEDAEFIGYHYNNDVVSDSGVSNAAELANEANEGCVLNIQDPFITILSS
jgi:hypothetical protein